jgi:hypothetical protein
MTRPEHSENSSEPTVNHRNSEKEEEMKAAVQREAAQARRKESVEQLAEWNALVELVELSTPLRAGLWTAETVATAWNAWNDVYDRKNSVTWALITPAAYPPGRVSVGVRALHRSVETLRAAIALDPNLRGLRRPLILDGPDLRLPDTIAEIRAAYKKRLTDWGDEENVDA